MIDPVELDRSSDDEEKKVQSTSNDPVESLVKETQVIFFIFISFCYLVTSLNFVNL